MINTFIAEKMSAYIAGGMRPETAAMFARGELGAIYKGNHRSRDGAGQWRVTQRPEDIPIEAARAKCDKVIKELLDYKAHNADDNGTAPENTQKTAQANSLKGFEELADYRGLWWARH
jgi:hypothetical protein